MDPKIMSGYLEEKQKLLPVPRFFFFSRFLLFLYSSFLTAVYLFILYLPAIDFSKTHSADIHTLSGV